MAALTEEQTVLKEQAKAWANEEAPISRFREMRDSGNEAGYDKATWASIGELGWAGIVVPEEFGGVDMGHLTFGVVLEELAMGEDEPWRPLYQAVEGLMFQTHPYHHPVIGYREELERLTSTDRTDAQGAVERRGGQPPPA